MPETTIPNAQQSDRDIHEAACHAHIGQWVKTRLDGEVTSITRLERWRPQWKVCYQKAGEERAVLFRGNRSISRPSALKFEMEVMQALASCNIKVPRIYGWVDQPTAFVMDWIDTEDRAPGMLHTAIDNPTTMDDQRWQAMLQYMDELAAIHRLPLSAFKHIERLNFPRTPQDIALHTTNTMYHGGYAAGHIDAPLSFLQHWLRRNYPKQRNAPCFLAGDAGQFMSNGCEVVALLDFEIAHIGDSHWDLACFRGRHPYENMGDIPALYERYARSSGKPVDLELVAYHTVNFLQMSAIASKFFMNPQAAGGNWIEGIMEYASISRRALEAIAELQKTELDYDLQLPDAAEHTIETSGLEKLMVDIQQLPTSTAFAPWERDLMFAIPKFLRNYSLYREWLEASAVSDVVAFTDQRPGSLAEADALLQTIVDTNDGSYDVDLVKLFHKRALRLTMTIAGTNPDANNPLFHKLDPILP
jgi:aminoglycoside phosphotransferase (APT) family kinase protein